MKIRIFCLAACFLLAVGSSWAGISVGSGGSLSLGQGALDLGGGDLTINGLFDVGGGEVSGIGDVVIGGTLEGGSGALWVYGDWINNGGFDAGTGQVSLLDDAGGSSLIMGGSTFHGLSMASSAGGSFVLESGRTQRVTNALSIQGVNGQPVQIQSSNPPQVAELVLDAEGSQNIAFVGVSDVYATGQHLAPEQTNQGGNGNDFGWFGRGLQPALPVPALSFGGLLILILVFFGAAWLRRGSAW